MTHFPAFLISFALLTSAHAEEEQAGGRPHCERSRKGTPSPEAFLKAHDQDGNGKITKEEFATGKRAARLDAAKREAIFARLDKNSDGFIAVAELQEMTPKKRRNPLAKADLDQDGRISKVEFAGYGHLSKMPAERRERIFTRLDKNSDGFLDQADGHLGKIMRRRRGDRPHSRIDFKLADLDQNGSLSLEEFLAASEMRDSPRGNLPKVFKRLDADTSGEISRKELAAGRGPRPNKRGRH